MSNPELAGDDPMRGTFALAALVQRHVQVQHWRGWPQGRWWNSPMLFLGRLLCQRRDWDPNRKRAMQSVWYRKAQPLRRVSRGRSPSCWRGDFPNRTPDWCGWAAPKGEESTIIGNYYATRFDDAWERQRTTLAEASRIAGSTARACSPMPFRESTLPAAVKEAASANLSTLASTTCFRTADGEFHGFEGVDDMRGCCFGNCTHVWNYETATAFLFPSFARSLRKASFGYSMDDAGAMHFRQLLPDGKERSAMRPPTDRWARYCMPISTGSCPATTSGCAACGRA